MSDSVSVVIDGEAATRLADLPVVPDTRGQCEQPLADQHPDNGEGAAAVALERELPLEGVDDRLDPLAAASERAEARPLGAAVGGAGLGAQLRDHRLQIPAGGSP